MDLRELQSSDIDRFMTHVTRHMAESGVGETPIFAPYEPTDPWGGETKRAGILARWNKSLAEPGWERAWGAFSGGELIAHLDARASELKSNQHRAMLGMGIELPYRRKGYGEALMRSVIEWSISQTGLAWLDLCVFAHNTAARALYKKVGFVETGRVPDAFRIAGRPIEDIAMTLRISR